MKWVLASHCGKDIECREFIANSTEFLYECTIRITRTNEHLSNIGLEDTFFAAEARAKDRFV